MKLVYSTHVHFSSLFILDLARLQCHMIDHMNDSKLGMSSGKHVNGMPYVTPTCYVNFVF